MNTFVTKIKEMRIKTILKEKNMSVQELADQLGVSRQALSKQINGKLLVETAQTIATALDVPLASLFDDYITEQESFITCPHCGTKIPVEVNVKERQ